MKLRRSNRNNNIAEDELGNDILEFKGLHPTDFDSILWSVNNYNKRDIDELEDEISDLKDELEGVGEAEYQLDEVKNVIKDTESTDGEKVEQIQNILL